MSEQFGAYGPGTLTCSRFGILTQALLWFIPRTYIYESPEGMVIYKKLWNTIYVLEVYRKPRQVDKAWES